MGFNSGFKGLIHFGFHTPRTAHADRTPYKTPTAPGPSLHIYILFFPSMNHWTNELCKFLSANFITVTCFDSVVVVHFMGQ